MVIHKTITAYWTLKATAIKHQSKANVATDFWDALCRPTPWECKSRLRAVMRNGRVRLRGGERVRGKTCQIIGSVCCSSQAHHEESSWSESLWWSESSTCLTLFDVSLIVSFHFFGPLFYPGTFSESLEELQKIRRDDERLYIIHN